MGGCWFGGAAHLTGSRVERVCSYDGMGRLISVTSGGADVTDEFHYDEQGKKTRVRTVPPRPGHEGAAMDVSIDVRNRGRRLLPQWRWKCHHTLQRERSTNRVSGPRCTWRTSDEDHPQLRERAACQRNTRAGEPSSFPRQLGSDCLRSSGEHSERSRRRL